MCCELFGYSAVGAVIAASAAVTMAECWTLMFLANITKHSTIYIASPKPA